MLRTKVWALLRNACNNKASVTRSLYSKASLGIDGFEAAMKRTQQQIINVDSFKTKMQEFVDNSSSRNLIFSEDLKNMVHLASDKNDVALLSKMVTKFCSQSKEARFGNFVFGPPIMRLFHHLNDADSALDLFKQEELDGFFDQLASYQVLFDLLFESGRYEDVLETFEIIKSRQVQGARFPKHAVVLTLAACYKLNTPASFEYASKVYKEATESGHIVMRKGIAFFAGLALKQGEHGSSVALEVLASVKQQNYLTIRTLKALAFAQLKRFDDSLAILKSLASLESSIAEKQTFPRSLIEELKVLFKQNNNQELQKEFEKVTEFLSKHGHISDNTIDDILCTEIQQTTRTENDRFRNTNPRYNSNYPRRDREYRTDQREFVPRRPGLHELN